MLEKIFAKLNNLEKCVLALTNRKYGERAEKALSETSRVERKEDSAVADLDDGIAEVMLMIVDVMKGE